MNWLPDALARLPERFHWTLHNVFGHPLSELVYQLGFEELSDRIHDMTIPAGVGPPRRDDH